MNEEQLINQNPPANEDEISLKELILKIQELWKYFLSKWIIILISGLLGGLLGFTYAVLQKFVYTARTTFVLESGDGGGSSLGQYAGIAAMAGLDLGGGGGGIFQGDNIIELYKSRKMIEKTLLSGIEVNGKRQLLIDQYIDFNQLRQAWAEKPELVDIQFNFNLQPFTRTQDSIVGMIVNDINKNYLIVAKLDKKLSIIKVEVKAKDEAFAKVFNEQIVKNVNDFYVQTKTKKALENVSILKQKVDSVGAVMNDAIYTAAAVSDATPNLNMTRQVQRAAPIQRSQFTAETNKVILGELVKNLEMSKIALLKETPLIQVVDEPVYPLDKEKFGKRKGVIFGGLIAGFCTIIILILKKLYRNILNGE
jgi:hypothetical protein